MSHLKLRYKYISIIFDDKNNISEEEYVLFEGVYIGVKTFTSRSYVLQYREKIKLDFFEHEQDLKRIKIYSKRLL